MGNTRDTGHLRNVLMYDSAGRIGIGGAVDASVMLKITGAASITGSVTFGSDNFVPNSTYLRGRNVANTAYKAMIGIGSAGSIGPDKILIDPDSNGTVLGGTLLGTSATFSGYTNVTHARASEWAMDIGNTSTNGYGLRIANSSTVSTYTLRLLDNSNATVFEVRKDGFTQINNALTLTGALTGTSAMFSSPNAFLTNTSTGTTEKQIIIANTGGSMRAGVESSSGGAIQIGTSAYAAVFGNQANYSTQFTTNGTVRFSIFASGKLFKSDGITEDNPIQIENTSATGYGSYFRGGGAGGRYIFKIADYAGVDKYTLDGNGNNTWDGVAGTVAVLTAKKPNTTSTYGGGTRMLDFKSYYPGFDVDTVKASIYSGVSTQSAHTSGQRTDNGYIAFMTAAAGVLYERFRIESSGGASFTSTVTSFGLEIENANGVRLYTESNGASWLIRSYNAASNQFRFNYSASGDVAGIANNTGVYTALSDKNKKKNFESYKGGLSEILQLKPTLYNMKTQEDGTDKELGFIAQEVQPIIPQAYTESGDFIGLNYSAFTPVLVNAIKELHNNTEESLKLALIRIQQLEETVKQLTS